VVKVLPRGTRVGTRADGKVILPSSTFSPFQLPVLDSLLNRKACRLGGLVVILLAIGHKVRGF
jgi:hypothetical protein